MARSKSKKIENPPPSVGKKRHRKPTAKASSAPVAPKQPKIKLTTASRPAKEPSPPPPPPPDSASGANEGTVELLSSSSDEETPEPERKTHMVSLNWQVYLNYKLVYSESFQEDFSSILHYGYRFWKTWVYMKAEDAAKTDKEIKIRRKWKALYGALSNRQVFHIEDKDSFERFEIMMVSRGPKGLDCIIEARFVTKGDPDSSPEPERASGKRRKTPDPPKLVYSDDDSDTKKSNPPVKKARKTATTVAIESLVEDRRIQSIHMEHLSLLSAYWRCNGGERRGCPNKNRQCFVHGEDHFRIELEDFHIWLKQWKKELPTETNLTIIPTNLIIKWI